jgi:outer membrane immunogenic protein
MKFVLSIAAFFAATASAVAADMPVKARPIAAPAYDWTGGYIGASAGYGWDRTSADYQRADCVDFAIGLIFGGCGLAAPPFDGTPPGPGAMKGTGLLGGLQAGYNQQFGAGLIGVEFDYNWARIKGDATSNFLYLPQALGALAPSNVVGSHKIASFATIRGRLGWLPTQTWLVYVTGGFAFANVERNVALTLPGSNNSGGGFGFLCATGLPCFLGASSRATVGWTVGAGSEFAISPNLTLKAEYLYANLAGDTFTVRAVDGGGLIPSSFQASFSNIDLHVVRIGINYRFNAPVVAKN